MEVITNVVLYFLQSDPTVTPEKRQLSPITEAPAPKRGKAVNVGLPGAPSDGVYHYDVHVLYDINNILQYHILEMVWLARRKKHQNCSLLADLRIAVIM